MRKLKFNEIYLLDLNIHVITLKFWAVLIESARNRARLHATVGIRQSANFGNEFNSEWGRSLGMRGTQS